MRNNRIMIRFHVLEAFRGGWRVILNEPLLLGNFLLLFWLYDFDSTFSFSFTNMISTNIRE